jgi:RHS repeat-associated protein
MAGSSSAGRTSRTRSVGTKISGEEYARLEAGQKLETYTSSWGSGGFASGLAGINIYFGGKLLQSKGVWVATDRLGSVRANSNGESMSYWPYGEERTNTANDREKFGTYMRDGVGQDYAMARYYNSSVGAFWTPDPGGISTANASDPTSWNRYMYVTGDPANHTDSRGMELQDPCGPDWMTNGAESGPCCDPSENSLLGAPEDPGCSTGGAGPAQAAIPSAPLPPSCTLELEYRGAGITGIAGRTHASIVVTDGEGYTFTIQGEPEHYRINPPWGKLLVGNTPGNINNQEWGPLLTSTGDPSLCSQVAALETSESNYSNDEVNYYPWGPNSNSLASWLLGSAGLSGYFTAPPGSTGWNTSLYGTFYGIH